MSKPPTPRSRRDIVSLTDLVPRRDVTGGAGKRIFGALADKRHGAGAAKAKPGGKPVKDRK